MVAIRWIPSTRRRGEPLRRRQSGRVAIETSHALTSVDTLCSMKHIVAVLGLLSAVAMTGCAACTAGADGDDNNGVGGNGTTGAGFGGDDFTASTGAGCDIHCSADLHSVLDCNDVVITTCPPDQGCSPTGQCVSPCQSAQENKSTIGCDFYAVTPSIINEGRGSCFAAMIANTWTSPVTVSANYGGQMIDAGQFMYIPQGSGPGLTYAPAAGGQLQPGQLGILFLSQYPSGDIFQIPCPVPSALNTSTQLETAGVGQAFQILTSAPIVAYDVYPWGGSPSFATSATLLLPTPTWGNNFVTSDGWEAGFGQPFTQFVAAEDNTTITFVPIADAQGGGTMPTIGANQTGTFVLNRGQVGEYLQATRLAGSVLSSDKPVSVWGGATCMNIPAGVGYCDAAHQQLLPVSALGNDYAVARYPSRGGDDIAPVSLIGMVDGTALTYDPMPPGAPPTLNRGQMAIINTDQFFSVKSQDLDHPFYVAAYMTGSGTGSGIGDPEYVNVIPPAQYLPSYLFVTDPTYRNTVLVFVRKRGTDGLFADVTLDCLGTVTGWQPIGAGGQYEVARPYLVQNGADVGGCQNGVHTASSNTPFGLTVWGYDVDVSYAYPAGMSVEPINTVIIPPIPK
jgi:hypothetical protein